ncbi:MAG: Amuc_1100 family pilus-like protein [Lentisphaerota bacterium]
MNFKKYMMLIIGGGVCLVLVIVEVVLLLQFHSAYRQVNDELQSSMSRLTTLYQRDPFPSVENVSLMNDRVKILQGFFDRLYVNLQEGQIEPEVLEPAQYPLLLEKIIRPLFTRAADNGVKIPPRFAFGFDRYALGDLPVSEDIPRLVVQVKTIDFLAGLLYKAKISEIVSIQRTVFEKGALVQADVGAEGRRRGRDRGFEQPQQGGQEVEPQDQGPYADLFSKEHVILTFKANDASVWELLNSLAKTKVFVVVTRLDMANTSKDVKRGADVVPPQAAQPARLSPDAMQPAVTPEEGTGTVETLPSREERVAAGREQVLVILEADVYRFTAPKKEEATP